MNWRKTSARGSSDSVSFKPAGDLLRESYAEVMKDYDINYSSGIGRPDNKKSNETKTSKTDTAKNG